MWMMPTGLPVFVTNRLVIAFEFIIPSASPASARGTDGLGLGRHDVRRQWEQRALM